MRALALHPDALLVTSALLSVNCVIVRGVVEVGSGSGAGAGDGEGARRGEEAAEGAGVGERADARVGESFVIDSPVLPDELDALPALIAQARFPAPSGLLATHGDWDHLLGRLAFPGAALGVAESTSARLGAAPGEAQRELRSFDEDLMIERPRPLTLGSLQALPVPGRCEVGELELELHPTGGHTADGMAVLIGWAGVLVVGDYLSSLEIPTLHGGEVEAYVATLERLRPLVVRVEHVVPGHGHVLDSARALEVLEEDLAYLSALAEPGAAGAELPPRRRGRAQRALHERNVAALKREV